MAIVQGIREKVHLPIYDSLKIDPEKQLRDAESSGTLKFFINVQNKTKLETNLQSASLLPHYNTFEARAMRVVISDLKAEFPDDVTQEDTQRDATDDNEDVVAVLAGDTAAAPIIRPVTDASDPNYASRVQVDLDIPLDVLIDLLKDARENDTTSVDLNDPDLVTKVYIARSPNNPLDPTVVDQLAALGYSVNYSASDLEDLLAEFDEKDQPLDEQVDPNNGSGSLIGKILYNTVTTLYVGEKIMIQMPTWFFPAGAGPYSETGNLTSNGLPSPQDTFRFAEPIFIDRQQNFRVEVEIPDADVLKNLQRIYGPFFMWVVLDGYMTRGVQ